MHVNLIISPVLIIRRLSFLVARFIAEDQGEKMISFSFMVGNTIIFFISFDPTLYRSKLKLLSP